MSRKEDVSFVMAVLDELIESEGFHLIKKDVRMWNRWSSGWGGKKDGSASLEVNQWIRIEKPSRSQISELVSSILG